MLYDKSFEIEERLHALLKLVREGDSGAPAIAEYLGVSIPTVSRSINALRRRGFNITAEKCGSSWRYCVIEGKASSRETSTKLQKASA